MNEERTGYSLGSLKRRYLRVLQCITTSQLFKYDFMHRMFFIYNTPRGGGIHYGKSKVYFDTKQIKMGFY